jgi:hypothetical protein
LVGTLERLCVNRVNVPLIVYEPIPLFAALGVTPLQVRKPVRIEVQAYRGYESPLSPSVLLHRSRIPGRQCIVVRAGYDSVHPNSS